MLKNSHRLTFPKSKTIRLNWKAAAKRAVGKLTRQKGRIPSARTLAAFISSRLNCYPLGVVILNLLLFARREAVEWCRFRPLLPVEDVDATGTGFRATTAAALGSVG